MRLTKSALNFGPPEAYNSSMSDIGGIFSPFDLALIALMIAAPGLVTGSVIGALVWRSRRIAGALLGAAAGIALWLPLWLLFRDAF